MIINYHRREELKQFSDDFNQKLNEAQENFKKNSKTHKMTRESIDETEFVIEHIPISYKVQKHKKISSPLWIPNKITGDYFGKFTKLPSGKDINYWDVERINMVERSYAKENGKFHWTPPGNKRDSFGYPNENCLSKIGKNIIGKFIMENQRIQSLRKQEEEYYENWKHSKHLVQINPWRYNSRNHLFSDYMIEKKK